MQGAGLHQHGGHRATALIETGLDDDTLSGRILRGSQFQHLGLQQNRLEQLIDPLSGLGRNLDEHGIATPVFRYNFLGNQFLTDTLGVGALLVDLVHCHHDRHLGRLGMVDGLNRLRHHAIVGRYHEDHDIGGLGTASPHGGERLVPRRIQEGDHTARGFHMVGTNVLGNATGLALHHFSATDVVQQ